MKGKMSIQTTLNAFIQNKKKITEYQKIIKDLRDQEKDLVKEIQSYLNEKNETGVRIDETTYISMSNKEKKINLTAKDHLKRVKDLLETKGINDDEFVNQILNKTSDIIQLQKLKITNN